MAKITYCNKCGKALTDKMDKINQIGMNGKIGYGSKYDGMTYEIDFCVDCFDKLVDTCTISPFDDDDEFCNR